MSQRVDNRGSLISVPLALREHKLICGIVPGLGGCQEFLYVFFGGHSLRGKNTN